MNTKRWIVLLASCLALAAAPLTGCGDDPDPSGNNDNNSANNGADANNGTPDGGNNNGTPDGGNNNDTPDAGDDDGGGDDGGGDDGGGNNTTGCTPNENFTGQAFAGGDDPHNGGNPVEASTVTLADSGLQAVWDAVPATEDNEDTADVDEGTADLDPALDVTEALVIATRGDDPNTADEFEGSGRFWIVDQNATLEFFYAHPEDAFPSEAVKVGDKVSFKVTQVKNFSGKPEITAVTDFTIDSSDNDVPFHDLSGQTVSADDFGRLVRIAGTVTADEGECGGSSHCWELTHGEEVITLRSSSDFIDLGTCAAYFGPLGAFPGPLSEGGGTPLPQLDTINFDWIFTTTPTQ